jgi:hypothetical protein
MMAPEETLASIQRGERSEEREGGGEGDQAKHEAKPFPHGGSVTAGRCDRN